MSPIIRPLAAAAAFAAAAAAQAQSSVSAYGLLDMSAGRFQTAGSDKVWRADSGNMTTSFLGFRGTEDLGGGLKARFTIEHFLRVDSGAAGRFDADRFWARSAWVGLEGGFGTTSLGRNTTPLFVTTLLFNPFGDSFGFSPSIRHHFAGGVGVVLGDTGWNNSIRYISPRVGGATVNLMANLAEGPVAGRNHSASLVWSGGPAGVALAWQDVGNGVPVAPPGFDGQRTFQLGGSYAFGAAKVFAQFSDVKTDAATEVKSKLVQLGASVPVGLGAVLLSYGRTKTEAGGGEFTRKTFSAGYDHYLSKSTDVYAVLMNDRATDLDGGTTLAAGLRLRF